MKVGSIVTGVKLPMGWEWGTFNCPDESAETYPVPGKYYTVTELYTSDGLTWAGLAELPEGDYNTEYLREIIFPESLESEITESLNRVLEEKI